MPPADLHRLAQSVGPRRGVALRPHKVKGHAYKIIKNGVRLDVSKYFFSNRSVDACNGLPQPVVDADVVDAESVNSNVRTHVFCVSGKFIQGKITRIQFR